MKTLLMSEPIAPGHQLRVLTDVEVDKVAGGVTAIEYGLIAAPKQSQIRIGIVKDQVVSGNRFDG